MSEAKFQVKLYGHTSDDVELFCKKLAAVLMISVTEAMILLHEVPLVVRDNLTSAEAEHLTDLLTSIRALAIAEPVDGVAIEKKPHVAKSVAPSIAHAIDTADERKNLRSSLLMYLGLGTAGFLIIFVIVGVLWSYFTLYSGAPTATPSPSNEQEAGATRAFRIDERTLNVLQARVERLQKEYEELNMERDAAQKDMYVADYRLNDPGEMDRRRARLRSVQAEMKQARKDLVDARLQLARMKKRLPKKASK